GRAGQELDAVVHPPPLPRRIVGNRLRIALVVLVSVAALLPFVAGLGYLGAAGLVRMTGSRAAPASHQVLGYADPLTLKVMPFTAGLTAALLGLLLWAMANSPTMRLLAESGALPPGPSDEDLVELLKNIAARAGIPSPKLYILPSNAPNLLCGGSRPENAVIGITRGALALLNEREREAVLAHGVSHIASYNIRLN